MYDQKQSSKGTTPSSYDTLSRASQRTEVSDRKQKATSLVVEIVNSKCACEVTSVDMCFERTV
jgi:hypothetical protein